MKIAMTTVFALALAAWGAGSAHGQEATSYTFGDWLVTCAQRDNALPCEMSQRLIDGESKTTVVRFSLAFSPDQDAYFMQIRVPLGVWLETGLTIRAGDTTVENIRYTSCLPDGCLVKLQLENALLKAMSNSGEGQLILVDAVGTPATLPFSLRGFDLARTRLATETRSLYQPAG